MTIEGKAAKLAEFIRRLPDFRIVTEIDGNYRHLGATIADAVLQANMKYETHVRPRISRIRRRYPEAATMSGLKKTLIERSASNFLDWRGMDRVHRFQDIVDLFSSERIEYGVRLRYLGIVAPRGYMRDGGRSSGVDMQVKVPNRLKLLWSKAMVVSVEEKAYENTSGMNQEGER